MPKQNKLHYFSFVLDYNAMVKDGRCITACGVRRSHLRSTWRMNDVNCEKCKATSLYAEHLAITIASRLKGDIKTQSESMEYSYYRKHWYAERKKRIQSKRTNSVHLLKGISR